MKPTKPSGLKNSVTHFGKITKPSAKKFPLLAGSAAPLIYVPQTLLWFGMVTSEQLTSPIKAILRLQNEGNAVWHSTVRVSEDWLTLEGIEELVLPPNYTLRLPVFVQPKRIKGMHNGIYQAASALQFDHLKISIAAWMLLKI